MTPTTPQFAAAVAEAVSAAAAGDLFRSAKAWADAVRIQPLDAAAWCNLGESFRRLGLYPDAIRALERATSLNPELAEAWFCLGTSHKGAGSFVPARVALERTVALDPRHERGWYNLGNLLREDGRFLPAIDAYRNAIALRPDWREARLNLSAAYLNCGKAEDAGEVLAFLPSSSEPEVERSRGDAQLAISNVDSAASHYRIAAGDRSEAWCLRLRADSLAEPIAPSSDWIDDYRTRLLETLEGYLAQPRPIDSALLNRSGAEPPMALAYHGRDDRSLKEAWARLFLDRIPDPGRPPVPPGRPKLGIVVTAGHEGVYDRCFGNVADRLAARGQLDVMLVSTRPGINVLRYLRPSFCGGYLEIPDDLDAAANAIRRESFSVLYYWEVGTDSTNYFLPFFRPAPVQVAGWGWPSTSGNLRIDYFLGSDLLDLPGAERHYTEKLVRLPGLPTLYDAPELPTGPIPRPRGVPEGHRLYLCIQNLRKLTPQFDRLLVEIFRTDRRATVAVIADERPRLTEAWRKRFATHVPDHGDRLLVLPRSDRSTYLGWIGAADVVVDPPGYGAGANTAADCAAAGTPVVTFPGSFHRGRWQAAVNGLLRHADCNVGSVEEYCAAAVRLATEGPKRERDPERYRQAFLRDAVVDEFERFFLDCTAR